MKAKFIYEKFVEDSDPVEDLDISKLYKERTFEDEASAIDFLIPRIPQILGVDKIPEDIINDKLAFIRQEYWKKIFPYFKKYMIIKLRDGSFPLLLRLRLLSLGYDDSIWKHKPIKESLNEKFVEDSDPVEDLLYGFNKKRTLKTEEHAAEYIVNILPQILGANKIPEDIINVRHYYIRPIYWSLINEYLADYITVSDTEYPSVAVRIYSKLYQMGFKDDFHSEKN